MELRKRSIEVLRRGKDVRCGRARANRPRGRVSPSNSIEGWRVATVKWGNWRNQRDDVDGAEEGGERGGVEIPSFLAENAEVKRVENGGGEKRSLHVMGKM